MDELLGLLDTLEASILDGKKVPFSDKVVINERLVLTILDRMRLAIKSDGGVVRSALTSVSSPLQSKPMQAHPQPSTDPSEIEPPKHVKDYVSELIKKAEDDSEKIKTGANEYADYVLANLQLLITKMQTNLVKIERNITGGRKTIDDQKKKGDKHHRMIGVTDEGV